MSIETKKSLQDIDDEILKNKNEIKLLNELQRSFSEELINYSNWQDKCKFNRTCIGRILYALGFIAAVVWVIRIYKAVYMMIYPHSKMEYVYQKTFMFIVSFIR